MYNNKKYIDYRYYIFVPESRIHITPRVPVLLFEYCNQLILWRAELGKGDLIKKG